MDLDQQFQSDTVHNGVYFYDAVSAPSDDAYGLSDYTSYACGGNTNGIYGNVLDHTPWPGNGSYAAKFTTTAPPATPIIPGNIPPIQGLTLVEPPGQGNTIPSFGGEVVSGQVDLRPYSPGSFVSAVSASHWCGTSFSASTTSESAPGTTEYLVVDGQANANVSLVYNLNSHNQAYISPNAINNDGVVVGNIVTNNYSSPVMIPYGGSATNLPGNNGIPLGINNHTTTNTNGTTTTEPQVVGNSSYYNGVGCLWDETYYNGTPTTNSAYIQKNLNYLIPGAVGTNPPPWNITSAVGINDSGAIVGTATYSGTNTAIAAGSHGVMLLPMKLESKDRMVKGSVNLPASWTGISLHFINTTTGQDLGTYNNVVENMTAANPTFKIYNSKDDIFSSTEEQQFQAGTLDPSASQQPVVFYKDTSNPACLHFATIFDDVGTVQVQIIKNGSVMGYSSVTLTADADFSSLISTVDNGISNPFPAPVVDPTDPNDPGGSGSSLGLLVAEEPGSLAVPGALDPSKNDPTKLVLPLHTGTALPSANDSDLSLITLRRPTGITSNVGTVSLTVSAPSSVALFNQAATHVLANYSVNLAAPAGDLAALASGNAQVWVRGVAANSDVTLTYTYTDANGVVQATDTVQLSVSTSGAMVWPGSMRNMPLFCSTGGIRGPPGIALSLMSMKVWSNVAQTAPPPPSKIKNNDFASKVMLVVWDAFTNQFTAPYLRGVAAGFGGAAYSDANTLGQIIILSVISQNPVGQYYIAKQAYGIADSYYQVYQTLAKLTAAQRQQVLDTLVLSAGIQAAGAIFQWQSLTPGQQQTDIEYAQGYVTGYVDWQIIICLATAGGAEALKGAITTAEAGEAVAVTVPKAMQVIDSAVAVASEVDAADVGLEADAFGKACGEAYPGLNITDGEVIANGLKPLDSTNGKATLEAFTQAVAKYTTGAQWSLHGKDAFVRLAQLLTALGTQTSSDAVVSFGELYARMIPTVGPDNFDQFMAMYDTTTDTGRAELRAFLENSKSILEDPASDNPSGGWPAAPGTAGASTQTTLAQGTIISRYGATQGGYVAVDVSQSSLTPFWARSLPGSSYAGLQAYEVLIPFDANVGRTAPWFGEAGGGKQAQLINGQSINYLLGANPTGTVYIEAITTP